MAVALNKIIGHHPGRMNTWVENTLQSGFTAGRSWNQINDVLRWSGMETTGKEGLEEFRRTPSRNIIRNMRLAHSRIPGDPQIKFNRRSRDLSGFVSREGRGKYTVIVGRDATKYKGLKYGINREVALKHTLAHEMLEISSRENYRNIRPFIRMENLRRLSIEHSERLPGWATETRARKIELLESRLKRSLGWTHRDIGVITGEARFANELGINMDNLSFGRHLTEIKNIQKQLFLPKKDIKVNFLNTDDVLRKHLQKESKFIGRYAKILEIGRDLPTLTASAVSKTMSKNIRSTLSNNPTAGLVNKVLHGNKINHTISNATKKANSAINSSLKRVLKILLR